MCFVKEKAPLQPLCGESVDSSASCEQTAQEVAPAAVATPAIIDHTQLSHIAQLARI